MNQFKEDHPLDKRIETVNTILQKYHDRVPIIVQKASGSDVPVINKNKFLVPMDITMGKFMYEIRKHIPQLGCEKAIFMYVGNALLPTIKLVSQIYHQFKDTDGFLYITYAGESTFGAN